MSAGQGQAALDSLNTARGPARDTDPNSVFTRVLLDELRKPGLSHIALTKSVGQEVAPYGIRVNAVCPGWVDTPLLAPMDPTLIAGIVMQIPRGRLATADELAELVRFLAGPDSSYCNGDVFAASGGFV